MPYRSAILTFILVVTLSSFARAEKPAASFAEFDRKAQAGERLNVVFFGASLTWGANASDPQLTSYRAVVGNRLAEKYPKAPFKFWDAAIGGTGSQLGLFRLERDCLRRKPDLVFLDFSANDDISSATPETLASYEAIVRRLVSEGVPVVQVVFPFKWNVEAGKLDDFKRREAHLRISKVYGTAFGDAIELAQRRVREKTAKLEELWPIDGVHPGDAGYALFADAAWDAFQGAVEKKSVCKSPSLMLNAKTYLVTSRLRISTQPLPAGWSVQKPNHVSAYFDMLMSRWQDEQVVTQLKPPDPAHPQDVPKQAQILRFRFSGTMAMLFGESTPKSGKYFVSIDGQRVSPKGSKPGEDWFDAGHLGKLLKGNTHLTQVLVEGLELQDHVLEIEPYLAPGEELRFESICVAGGGI